VRRVAAALLAAATVLALLWSVWKDVPHSWRLMRSQHAAYAGYDRTQRDEAFGALIPIRMDIFEWWRAHLQRGDRYWIQIPHETFSANADKKLVVRTIAHLFLLPATEARSLSDATIVLSWDADPSTLHLRYLEKDRAGLQLIFATRLSYGT
jgi:hypothetical protein